MRRLAFVVALLSLVVLASRVRDPFARYDRRYWRIVNNFANVNGTSSSGGGSGPIGNPDSGNLIFVTSAQYTGNLGGLAGADIICANHAADAGLRNPSSFIALLNTSTVTAFSRLPIDGGWKRTDNRVVARSREQLLSGGIHYQPILDEHGVEVPWDAGQFSTLVWTGLIDGGIGGTACADWSSTSGTAEVGDSARGGTRWFDRGLTRSCSESRLLYCASNDGAAVPDAPVRSSRLMFLSSNPMPTGTGIGAMDAVCQNEAADAGLYGTFIALLPPDAGHAPSFRLDAGPGPWSRLDGTLVAATGLDLFDAGYLLSAPGVFTATGAIATPVGILTGNTNIGDPYVDTGSLACAAWTDPPGSNGNAWAGANTGVAAGLVGGNLFGNAATANCRLADAGPLNTLQALCIQTNPSPDAGYYFCDSALVQGDRSGTWGCLNGDGTAAPGDNLGPWVATGTPSTTWGSTCSAPSYQTLTTATPAQRFESTAAVTSVPSAFSWCALYEATSTLKAAFFWGNYPCCSGYAMTVEESVTLRQYTTGGASVNSLVTVGTDKTLICGSYSGGTAAFYIRNATLGTSYQTGAGAPAAAAGYKITFGADSDSSATKVDGRFYGGFYTEKAMVQADFDAIYANVIGGNCL